MSDRQPTSVLERVLARQRASLLAEDADALSAVVRTYAPIRARLITDIDALVAEITERGTITGSEAVRLERARILLRQTEAELRRMGVRLSPSIQAAQTALVEAAQRQAVAMTMAQAGSMNQAATIAAQWTRLPTAAVAESVERLRDGRTLDRYFTDLATGTRQRIEQAIIEGVARGTNPREVARRLTAQTNIAGERLLTATRNEMLGSFRGAALQSYAANSDILRSWAWVASLSDRTCPACLSLHGREFPLTTTFMPNHSRCRCSPAPVLRDAANPFAGEGEAFFRRLPAAQQAKVLRFSGGDLAVAAIKRGEVDLADFIVTVDHPRWGRSLQPARSLDQAVASAARRVREAA